MSVETDVVRRICGSAHPSLRCPLPPSPDLYNIVAYVVDVARSTRGELVTLYTRHIRLHSRHRLPSIKCLVVWFNAEDCVVAYNKRNHKVIFRRACLLQKLGLI